MITWVGAIAFFVSFFVTLYYLDYRESEFNSFIEYMGYRFKNNIWL